MGPSRIVILSGLLLLALAGCATAAVGTETASEAPDQQTATAEPTTTAQPAENVPFTCADLVDQADADEALASPSTPSEVGAFVQYLTPSDVAPTAAGGIRCVWLADNASADASAEAVEGWPGSPWLDVEVLPGAADRWTSYTFGDDTSTDQSAPFAGFTGARSCGDPGCKATAPIGTAWVSIMVHVPGLDAGYSQIGTTGDEVFEKLTPAATALFDTIAEASPEQLDWPANPVREADPAVDICSSFLRGGALSTALGVSGASADYHQAGSSSDYFLEGAAADDARFVECFAEVGFEARVSFTLMPDNAGLVDTLAGQLTPRSSLHPETLEGQVSGEIAVSNCEDGRADCDIWFTLGTDAIYVSFISTDSRAVANSILAQAR